MVVIPIVAAITEVAMVVAAVVMVHRTVLRPQRRRIVTEAAAVGATVGITQAQVAMDTVAPTHLDRHMEEGE